LLNSFSKIRDAARTIRGARVAVPMGHDPSSIEALLRSVEEGLASAVVIAPSAAVKESLEGLGATLPREIEIQDVDDAVTAASRAVELVRAGEATMLMKGMLKTSLFLKAILDEQAGLRTGQILSHVAVIQSPMQNRIVAVSDGGLNIHPDEEALRQIAINAAGVIEKLGGEPRVAFLAAIEVENEKIPETILFAKLSREGIPGLKVDGPMAVDGAMDPEAAAIKGMTGPVAGQANVLIAPDISCCNIFAKGLMYMAGAEGGGLIAGAAAPVVMLSRSDQPITKINSLAMGVVTAGGGNA